MAVTLFLEFVGSATGGPTGPLTVVGESLDKAHPKTTEVLEASFDIENPITIGSTTGGAGAGKLKFGGLNITKWVDNASPTLFQALATGAHFPTVKMYVRKPAGTGVIDYLVYQFNMVFVSKIELSGALNDDGLRENVQFAYGAMQVNYTPTSGPTGMPGKVVTAMWSQVTNTPTMDMPGM